MKYNETKLPTIVGFHDEKLRSIITFPNGKPDFRAIQIYSDFRSWFKPKSNGLSKLKSHGVKTNYRELSERYQSNIKTLRLKLVLLEKLGLITRDLRTETHMGTRSSNILYILVWKQTPHFYNEYGLDREIEDNQKADLQEGVFRNSTNADPKTTPDQMLAHIM